MISATHIQIGATLKIIYVFFIFEHNTAVLPPESYRLKELSSNPESRVAELFDLRIKY